MRVSVIASGSKGNLTYIESNNTKILIDAGISFQEATRRAKKLGINLDNIDAIFVTHEHRDHIQFLPTFLKRTNAAFFINQSSLYKVPPELARRMSGYKFSLLEKHRSLQFKNFQVKPILLSHDSANCFGFVITANGKQIFYATDTGFLPLEYIPLMKESDMIIIESNHDIEMLNDSLRPRYLKDRILSTTGHMSNHICGTILKQALNSKQKYIVLAHLSEDCNTKQRALDTIFAMIDRDYHDRFLVAKQRKALPILEV